MGTEDRSRQRHEEIEAILERKSGVREVRDESDRDTVVGAASRGTYANWLTPIEDHFVCHRNPIPDADDDWTVSLSGALDGEMSMADLRDLPTVAVAHTMECAGNNRGQHDPETGDVQWDAGAVGTAIWTGAPVSSVLRAGGLDSTDEDRWLTAIGGDRPVENDVFARSIPLSKALDDCILAYGMNGGPLPAEHGFPVRLVVPGWYGVNSVKWIEELRVTDSMVTEGSLDRPGIHAKWQQESYRLYPAAESPDPNGTVETADTQAQLESPSIEHPYTFDQNVMSLIGAPTGEESIESGDREILGVAWAGDDAVSGVEVSVDGGETWTETEFFGPDYANAWRLFRARWEPDPGTYTLLSRATDDRGRIQPPTIGDPDEGLDVPDDEYPWNEGGYGANAYLPNAIVVEVA